MSTDTPERTHDAEADPDPDRQSLDSEDDDQTSDSGGSDDFADSDDELVVTVYPRRVHEQLQGELDARDERPCREYEAEYADLLAERGRLIDEVAALERQLERAGSRLDAVVEQYERILAVRDESDAGLLTGEDGDAGENSDADEDRDDEQVGRRREVDRREADLAARLRNWLR